MKTVQIEGGISLTEEQVMKAYKKLQEPELYERCKEGYAVYGDGDVRLSRNQEYYDNFNIFSDEKLAAKAAKLMHESNKLIYACLAVEHDLGKNIAENEVDKLMNEWKDL